MTKQEFKNFVLSKLLKKNITRIIAGGSNGSIIILDIGNSDFTLFVNCVWRLEQGEKVLSGWNESNDANNGNMTIQIMQLKEDVIKSIEISDFFDLKIQFSSGKILNVFCDVTPKYEPMDYDENWSICDIQCNKCYAINRDFMISLSDFK